MTAPMFDALIKIFEDDVLPARDIIGQATRTRTTPGPLWPCRSADDCTCGRTGHFLDS